MTGKTKVIIGSVVGGIVLLGGIGSLSNNKSENSNSSRENHISMRSSADFNSISSDLSDLSREEDPDDPSSEYIVSSLYSVKSPQSSTVSSPQSSSSASMVSTTQSSSSTSAVSTTQSSSSTSAVSAPKPSGSTSTLFPEYSKPATTAVYVLNTNTKKFHYSSCAEVKKIKPKNYSTASNRSEAINAGYSPCKKCNP